MVKKQQDIKKLIELTLKNKEMYREIVNSYQDKIYYYCLKNVGNKEDAKDLSQEVFVKAFFHLKDYKEEYSFNTWIYKIASNSCITYLKRNKPVYELKVDELKSNDEGIFEKLVKEELGQKIRFALNKIDRKYKKVLTMYYIQDNSYVMISKALNLNLNTVKTHLRRAKLALKNELNYE